MQNETAKRVASQRLDLVIKKFSLHWNTTRLMFRAGSMCAKKGEYDPSKLVGFIKISIRQKETRSDGKPVRKLETLFGESRADMNVYDNFVQQLSNSKRKG